MKIALFGLEPWEKEMVQKEFPKDQIILDSNRLSLSNASKFATTEIISIFIDNHIDKKYYGWCEYVTAKPCQNVKALKRFYKRAGSLLAILHILSGSDIHRENLIAHGEYPVIVDFECLLQPNLSINQQQKIQRTLVSQTFFLPKRMMRSAGTPMSLFQISKASSSFS